MEKQHNHDYGQFDPDYIEQNTLVDGTYSNEDEFKQVLKNMTIANLAKAILIIMNKIR